MKKRRWIWVAAVAFIGAVGWFSTGSNTRVGLGAAVSGTAPGMPRNAAAVASVEPKKTVSRMSLERAEINLVLARALAALRQGKPVEVEAALVELDEMLGGGRGNGETAIAAILEFLRTGQDAVTGKGFFIADGGALTEATTLRVYLMDKLGQICREVGSEAALGVAREVLHTFGSADEWAVSMRNVAWLDPASREFLQDRVLAMLNHREWREQPSTGMLEAFDVIVHTGAMATVPELSRLVSAQNSPLTRASSVALDRLAGQSGLELTTLLNQQPELLSATPLLRADLFAHADLGVPAQREQLENYLLRPEVDAFERKKFFSALIQTGQFMSHNLITPDVSSETPEHAAARLDLLTQTVNGWLRDERFGTLTGELTALGAKVNRVIDQIGADEISK
jgi:hypothetical protein